MTIKKLKTIISSGDHFYDLLITLFFSIGFGFMFFYNLGGTSLIDFDEAWYAEIARNIIKDKQPFVLSFNDSYYLEHPPLGFILIALSFLILGISEFAARLPSAILGLGAVIVTYFLGKKLFNREVGFGAALMLVSSVWFAFRARLADLDTIFLFFFLLTFYLATNIKTDRRWVFPFAASFALTFLTKSLIGVSILVPVILYLVLNRVKIPFSMGFKALVIFFALISPWVVGNFLEGGLYFFYHTLKVGLRSGSRMVPNFLDLNSALSVKYLHFGVREWFYPSIVAFFGSIAFVRSQKELIPVYALVVFLMTGFLTNQKTEIWHLIPLYPFLGLLIAFFLYKLVFIFGRFLSRFPVFNKILNKNTMPLIIIFPLLFLSLKQIYEFKNDINIFDHSITGLAYTAKAAKNENGKLYLDNENFLPSAVFYSNKKVFYVRTEASPKNTLEGLIDEGEKPLLILTENYRLQIDGVEKDRYEVLSEHLGHVLIRVN